MVLQVQDVYGVPDSGDYSSFSISVSGTNINTVIGVKDGSLYTFSNLAISLASNSFSIPYALTESKGILSLNDVKTTKVISADKFIVTEVPVNYYTFFTSTFSVSLTDSTETVFYTTSTTIQLTESTSNIQGGGSKTSSTGIFSYTVHFTVSGPKTLTFTYGDITESVSATVTKSVLKIVITTTVINIQPTLSSDTFNVDVYVNNIDGGTTTNYVSSNSISLQLKETTTGNSGNLLSGTTTKNTDSAGLAAFTSLNILSSGSFKIEASSTEITSAESITYNIKNLIKTMSLAFNHATIYTFMTVTATLTIIGEDDQLFLGDCSVILSESNNYLKNLDVGTNSDGTLDFPNLYFSNYGAFTIVATSTNPSLTDDFDVSVTGSVIDISFDADVIFT